jgi:hypothetical protein
MTANATELQAQQELTDVLKLLHDRLNNVFRFPDDSEWQKAIADAQNVYEQAKRTETAAIALYQYVDEKGHGEFEAAVTRLVAAAPKKPDGTSTLARTPAEKLAEIEDGYAMHKQRVFEIADMKRKAENWHSIAYQRLETLREVFKKS